MLGARSIQTLMVQFGVIVVKESRDLLQILRNLLWFFILGSPLKEILLLIQVPLLGMTG